MKGQLPCSPGSRPIFLFWDYCEGSGVRLGWDHIIQRGRGADQAILESSALMENDEPCNHVCALILNVFLLHVDNELKLPAKCFLMN